MANTIDAFFERLTAASGDFNAATVGQLSYLDAVYLDLKPEVARVGQTIRVPFPDVSAFTDQGLGDWTADDVNPGYVDVVISSRPGKAIKIHDFEQFQTSTDMIKEFLDPLYKRAQEFANAQVAAQVTAANFNAYAPFQSSVGTITPDDAADMWDLLVSNKVPLSTGEASLICHNNIHRNTLTSSDWVQQNQVGADIAASARQGASQPGTASNRTFQFARYYDQQAPTDKTANLTGTVAATAGSPTITGTGTSFTAQAPVGSYLYLNGDATAYRVKAVASDTSLTLSQAYPTTIAGKSFTRKTYTSVAMNKYAIALAVRPLVLVNNGQTTSRLIMLKGLPVRVQLSYQHQMGGAYLLTADYAMAAKVLRPSFGVICQS